MEYEDPVGALHMRPASLMHNTASLVRELPVARSLPRMPADNCVTIDSPWTTLH
ncbi:MAG: hypothetical protein ACJAQZ_002924 [Planctomycetota bacterium]|jgi:hypothetical protein